MNKKLLAIAVGAAVAFPAVALADGPTVYGKVNVDLKQVSVKPKQPAGSPVQDDQWELESNASRIGFKGEYDLDVANLKAIYQAEFQINVDDGAGPFSQRNIFAGLKGGFGTVKAGRFDTPTKEAQGKVDLFNDLDGDIGNLMAGENRMANIIQYSTPKLGDMVTINAAFIPAENTDIDDYGTTLKNENGLADSTSISAVLETGGLYAAVSMDSDIDDDLEFDDQANAGNTINLTRLVGAYKFGDLQLGAIYQIAKEADKDTVSNKTGEETSTFISASFGIDRIKLKAQYGVTDAEVSKDTATGYSLGADYKLAKASKAFVYYTAYDIDYDAVGVKNDEQTSLGVGIEHKF